MTEQARLVEVANAERDARNLGDAMIFAANWHDDQLDKCGQPYMLHPLRVMLRCNTSEERVVALLHDVIEDTSATVEHLRDEGFTERVISAVVALTKRDDETYNEYISRVIVSGTLACRVKLADLEDNMDIRRLPITFAGQIPGYQRYAETHLKIRKALANG